MDEREEMMNRYNRAHLIDPEFNGANDVIWTRDEQGFHTNVRQRVMHHSPSGFEAGYAGSGPADFALNICAVLFPAERGREDNEQCFHGQVSRAAWGLHQKFKFRFLAGADKDEGVISHDQIRDFLQSHAPARAAKDTAAPDCSI